ncbi:DNA primase/helicase [Arthrobacter phage DrManhattan]|uniref:DNA primase/helicase n=2 Tax=Manhattanvirus drmanhattan TaxID=2734250 RepID=A0A3G2KFM3_9CAUD|nr:DNA primase [Arthrobacter phage DrManhattan]AYN57757.1 DNA primase/helicase [Arthrobacter phage DrManhattan]QHB36619.1 DNA primase/helicase [Arthrobacter phage Adolin]
MTLADLIAKLDDVETTSDGYLVHCPAHADSKQSLRLTVSDQGKVLMRCRAGCDTKDVVAALGLTMRDLATMTAGDVDLSKLATSQDVPASPADVAALAVKLDRYAADLARKDYAEADAALTYAATRFGVDAEDVARLGLGYADDLGGGPRLVVPFRDRDGVPRGFQARALDKDAAVRWLGPKSPDGASWAKIGYFPGSAGFDEVLITEGPGDALTASSALGFDTIGIRGAGLSANPTVISDLVAMLGGRDAVVAGDGDPAGRRFSATLAEALVGHEIRVKVLDLPDGLDLSDWRAKNPARFYQEAIRAIAEAETVKSRTAALLAWDEERYSLTDLGGARYLRDYVESLGSGIRYSEEVGFFLLEDGVWRKDERQGVRTHAQSVADLVRNLAREAANAVAGTEEEGVSAKDKKRAARLNRYAAHVQTSRGIDAMLRELQAVQGVPASVGDFDQHPDLLACRNGVVDLRTGVLRPHDPALLLTRRVEFDYDPEAKAPRWEEFLEQVFPKYKDLPAYMQRLVGYGITGHTTEQCFAVLWGTGANGKSVYTDTLTEVFRELTTTTPFSTFEDRASGGIPNDLAALKGARLVMAAEGEQGRPMAESVLKRVTGRDLIAARFMRKEFFEFRPTFLLNLATNFKPSFKGQDEGLWRRVKLIPWERYFAPHERDHRLGEKLMAEAEGIFAWAVRGAIEWYKVGLNDPAVIRNSTKEYRETSDALAGFLPGVFVQDSEAGRVDGKVLFDEYLKWADEENLPQREIWTRRTFFGALEERGLTKRKTNKGVAFDGIRRARQTDAVPDHAEPEEAPKLARAGDDRLALSSTETTSEVPPISGADLDAIL